MSWQTSISTSWSWRGKNGILFLHPQASPGNWFGLRDSIKAPSNTPQSPLKHKSVDDLLAVFYGAHWPKRPVHQPSLPLLYLSNLQPCLLTGTKSLMAVDARRRKGMQGKQMVHPRIVYWAWDPLKPGRFEMGGFQRRGSCERVCLWAQAQKKSAHIPFPNLFFFFNLQSIFFPAAKHGSPCFLCDKTISTNPWQEALV